jgi:hypothetical protein
MSGHYRVDHLDGRVEYTDQPTGGGTVRAVRPDGTVQDRQPHDHQAVKDAIKAAQTRVPKVIDYLNYLDYLRHHSPVRFDHVMEQLHREDPQTWMKLQKVPQFRPLRETVVGLRAGEKMLSGGVGVIAGSITGKFTGSAEKWMETTLNDFMKRDRWGPYADVLGAKATTLASKPASYSNSRLGQYLKAEDASAAAAGKAVAKDLEAAKAGLRAAKGAAVVRVMGPLVDAGIGLLDPEMARATANGVEHLGLRKDFERGLIDEEQWAVAKSLLAAGRFQELTAYRRSIREAKR